MLFFTIVQHNQACSHFDERWYINEWSCSRLTGGWLRDLCLYLQEIWPLLLKHHQELEIHPNVNRKSLTIRDQLTIVEEPPPPSTLWPGDQVILPE